MIRFRTALALVPVAAVCGAAAGSAASSSPVVFTDRSAAARDAAVDYWTPDRMRKARPAVQTPTPRRGG